MLSKKGIGWALIVIGLLSMFLPALSGFTSFFHSTYAVYIPEIKARYPIFNIYTIVGAVFVVMGLALARPKKETLLSE